MVNDMAIEVDRAITDCGKWLDAKEHKIIINLDLRVFGGSALTDDIAVPRSSIADQ